LYLSLAVNSKESTPKLKKAEDDSTNEQLQKREESRAVYFSLRS
jgi:hypothetical protein